MGFRTIFSGNNTYLICTLGRKDKISYTQLDMFKNEAYKEYFIIPNCTKNGIATKISFDISGLTSLSEYIKTRLEQKQYFDIISGIQKIASFCKSASLPFENLICDPKYMYYHNVNKKILMAFVPVQSPRPLSMDIPECLLKIHKSAKDVIIKDGNYMGKYEEYLSRFQGKKSKAQTFSPDSLQHFFNENAPAEPAKEYKPIAKSTSNIVYVNDPKFNIHEQITVNHNIQQTNVPENTDSSSQFETVRPTENHNNQQQSFVPGNQHHYEGGTFIPPEKNEPKKTEEQPSEFLDEMFDAYLIDPNGKKIYIDDNPFTIGRVEPKSLVIDEPTVSGKHAKIKKEYNIYYLSNWLDSNGTFLNENFNERITSSVPLNDGDRIYFYRTCYTFHTVKKPDPVPQHTVIIQPHQNNTNHTVVVSQPQEARAVAYIIRVSDNNTLRVMQYPFTDDSIHGVVFSMETINNRTVPFIENIDCYSLKLENVDILTGMKKEIFSGCSLFINAEKYTFIIEN